MCGRSFHPRHAKTACPGAPVWRNDRVGLSFLVYSISKNALDFEPDGPHQRQRIAGLDDARVELVIEAQLPVFQVIFEVAIDRPRADLLRDRGQSQIMRAYQPHRASFHQFGDDGSGSDQPIVRVGSRQQLVQQKKNRNRAPGQVHDLL